MTPVFVGLACLFGPLSLLLLAGGVQWLIRRLRRADVYPPEAADAPDPVDEHFKTSATEEDQLEAAFRLPAYIKEQSNG